MHIYLGQCSIQPYSYRVALKMFLGFALVLQILGGLTTEASPRFFTPGSHPGSMPRINVLEYKYVIPYQQPPSQKQQSAAQTSRDEQLKEIEKFEKMLNALRAGKPNEILGMTLLLLGYKYMEMGDKNKAINFFSEALKTARTLNDSTLEGTTLATLGMIYADQGEPAIAIKFLDQALPILQSKSDKFDRTILAGTLNSACMVYTSQGNKQKGLTLCFQALEINRNLAAHQQEALTLRAIGAIYYSLGKSREAFDNYDRALSLNRKIGDKVAEAEVMRGIGSVYDSLGQWEKALDYYNRSLLLMRSTNHRKGETITLNNIASVYDKLGDKNKAIGLYGQALEIEKDDAATLNNIGLLFASKTEIHKALVFLDKALSSSKAQKDRRGEAITLVNIGNVYENLGEHTKVLGYLNQALPVFHELQDPNSEAATLHNIGRVYTSTNNKQKAIDHYEKALQIRRSIGDREGEAHTLSGLGVLYNDARESAKALELYNQSLSLLREVGDRAGEAMVLDNMGHTYFSSGQKEKAFQSFSEALSVAKVAGDRRRISLSLSNIGSIYESKGDLKKALENYQQSIETDEAVRKDARLEEFKTTIAGKSSATYLAAITLNLRLGNPREAFAISERARARTFLDQLGNTRFDPHKGADIQIIEQEQRMRSEITALGQELSQERAKPSPERNSERIQSLSALLAARQKEYTDLLTRIKLANPEYASLISISPSTLPDIQKILDADTTLLSYIVTPDKTVAFLISQLSFRAIELKVSERDLQSTIRWFRQFADLDEAPIQNLKQLYSQLITPLRSYIRTSKLCIIPHGILHYFPFVALTDGQRYLGDDYQIFYLPSVSSLAFVQKKQKPHSERLLAAVQQRAEGLPFLRYAVLEAKSVASLYETQALINETATESVFRDRVGDHDLVFLATHGQLNQANPLFSRIILAPDKDGDGSLEVHEIYSLNLVKTDLVVLSACDTQLGTQSRGDDIIGLNRAFIYAGAPSVIASLWRVDDEATGVLIKSFFTHLKQGMSKAAALRAAQAETRAIYPHPYYWAAFVLTGDPGIKD